MPRCGRRPCPPANDAPRGETLSIADTCRDQGVIARVGDNGHGSAVFRRSADHGWSADVDLFDGGGLIGTGAYCIGERVQVHDHQVERLDIEFLKLRGMVLIGHIGKNTGMDVGIEGLDSAIKAFRESGDFGYFGHLHAQISKTLRGGTGGDHFGTCLDESLGKNLDAFLMEDRYQSSSYRSVRCCHPVPPYC